MLGHRGGVATQTRDRLNRGFVRQVVRLEPHMTSDACEFRMRRLVEDRFVGKKRDGLLAGAFFGKGRVAVTGEAVGSRLRESRRCTQLEETSKEQRKNNYALSHMQAVLSTERGILPILRCGMLDLRPPLFEFELLRRRALFVVTCAALLFDRRFVPVLLQSGRDGLTLVLHHRQALVIRTRTVAHFAPVSYTHLTLPTNREV